MDPGRAVFIIILIAVTIVVAVILNSYPFPHTANAGNGILTGNVTIGPLCPVEPCTVTPDQLAAVYAARRIVVSDAGGSVIAKAVPDPNTGYTISLKPGNYTVDIMHQGIDRSPVLPKTISIRAGEKIRLDISIDTGIR
jgi:hypothetical protein